MNVRLLAKPKGCFASSLKPETSIIQRERIFIGSRKITCCLKDSKNPLQIKKKYQIIFPLQFVLCVCRKECSVYRPRWAVFFTSFNQFNWFQPIEPFSHRLPLVYSLSFSFLCFLSGFKIYRNLILVYGGRKLCMRNCRALTGWLIMAVCRGSGPMEGWRCLEQGK